MHAYQIVAKLDAELKRIDIIKCIKSNERIRFRGVNLSGLDLLKLDLTKIDFSYACLRNVCFSNCDLHSAKLNYVDAKGANFSDASLERSESVGANLYAVTLYLSVPILALQRKIVAFGEQAWLLQSFMMLILEMQV
ncbi:FH protein interacting protein FIP2-like [Prunus yedoensis var. nudiflora]|uniref:FH protein interacting protein FIP2-like n=1 Tax=Prunus yedoensis var. nudiflora TaxID=2094558 RepID=A0A314ZKP8_PRUYE|nr:FH protein interacting protein FIP2-like [Prunus yedoensis var. nudiflora]